MIEPDVKLEKALDKAGRDKVFDYLRSMGWLTTAPPPKWVWWAAIEGVSHD